MQDSEMQLVATRQRIIDATKKVLHDHGIMACDLGGNRQDRMHYAHRNLVAFQEQDRTFSCSRRDFLAPAMKSLDHMFFSESLEVRWRQSSCRYGHFLASWKNDPIVLQLYYNMMLRCEYADEFS